jgi:hypothetical protein
LRLLFSSLIGASQTKAAPETAIASLHLLRTIAVSVVQPDAVSPSPIASDARFFNRV